MLETALHSPLDSEKPGHFSRPAKSPFGDAGAGAKAAIPESAALGMLCRGWLVHRRVQPHSKCQQLINA